MQQAELKCIDGLIYVLKKQTPKIRRGSQIQQ